MADRKVSVEWSHLIRTQATEMRKYADAKPHGAHASLLHGLERLYESLEVPDACFNPENALKDDLKGIQRVYFGQRGRIFYVSNPTTMQAVVLYFGQRKHGDKNDAYSVMTRLLRGHALDRCFDNIGLKKPTIK